MAASVKIVNKTSYASKNIHWICFGMNTSNVWGYLAFDSNNNATWKPFTKGASCLPHFNTLADIASFRNLPELISGQIMFSCNSLPKQFSVSATGGLTLPSIAKGAKDFKTIISNIELTNDSLLNINSTQVDQLCVPISLRITNNINTNVVTTGILKPGHNSSTIFKAIKKLGSPWNKLIVSSTKNGKTTDIRAIGPQHGVEQGLFPTNYYDKYIDAIWKNFANTGNNTLTIKCPNFGTYKGQTDASSNTFVFKQIGKADVTINKPGPNKAYDIFGCVGTLNAPNNTDLGEVATILGAALNRSILKTSGSDTQPNCAAAKFYSIPNQAANLYSKTIHDGYRSGIYAFPYDDVCSKKSPLLVVNDPKLLTITLNK